MLTLINKHCIHISRQPFHVVVFGTEKKTIGSLQLVVGPHKREWRQINEDCAHPSELGGSMGTLLRVWLIRVTFDGQRLVDFK